VSAVTDLELETEETAPEAPLPVTLQLHRFDDHGTTRAGYKGRWLEVEHGIPGETVLAELTGSQRRRAHILEVLAPSPDRVEAPCEYFREWACGGCQWQHISYGGQLARKRELVETALRDAGLDLEVGKTYTLDEPWRYRSTAGVALGRRAGFRRHGSLAIVPIRDCLISHPLLGRLMAHFNDLLAAARLPDFRGRVRLDVQVVDTVAGERLQVLVRPTDNARQAAVADIDALIAALAEMPEVSSITRQMVGGTLEAITGTLFGIATVAGRAVTISSGSFFQANVRLLPVLIERLRQASAPLAGKSVADYYGGVGVFGLFLAEEAAHVVVVESDRKAIEAGQRSAKSWGLANVDFVHARVEKVAHSIADHDILVLDPPRSGLAPELTEALIDTPVETVLYISCLAQSLARDLQKLQEVYDVESLELFDFYPQTYHVELLAVLRRSPTPRELTPPSPALARPEP
jgi:23S rRNA (uracil1939-C5)-methyltransferase